MDKFIFWKNYLLAISISLIIMGVFIAFFKNTPFFVLFSQYIDPVFWPNGNITINALNFKSFIYSFSGTYIILWGMFLLIIVKYAFVPENKWVWNGILATTVVWLCIMFPFSLYYKVYVNAWGDVVFFILLILPLFFTRKYFYKE